MDPLLLLVRVVLAVVLLLAVGAKLKAPRQFTDAVRSYNLVSGRLIPVLAGAVLVCEVVIGVLLVIGYRVGLVVSLAGMLLLLFALVVGRTMRLSSSPFRCGCLGDSISLNASAFLVVANALLGVSAVLVGLWGPAGASLASSGLTSGIVGFGILLGVMYWLGAYAATILGSVRQ
ncbi:MAG: hypothetical protein GY788_29515 [bacterium]|nr:hypothetical protein [bacterium]